MLASAARAERALGSLHEGSSTSPEDDTNHAWLVVTTEKRAPVQGEGIECEVQDGGDGVGWTVSLRLRSPLRALRHVPKAADGSVASGTSSPSAIEGEDDYMLTLRSLDHLWDVYEELQ